MPGEWSALGVTSTMEKALLGCLPTFSQVPGLCPRPWLSFSVPASDVSRGLPSCRLTNFKVSRIDSWTHPEQWQVFVYGKAVLDSRTACNCAVHGATWRNHVYFQNEMLLIKTNHRWRLLVKPFLFLRVRNAETIFHTLWEKYSQQKNQDNMYSFRIFVPLLSVRGKQSGR